VAVVDAVSTAWRTQACANVLVAARQGHLGPSIAASLSHTCDGVLHAQVYPPPPHPQQMSCVITADTATAGSAGHACMLVVHLLAHQPYDREGLARCLRHRRLGADISTAQTVFATPSG
jgi:hypothetical protein